MQPHVLIEQPSRSTCSMFRWTCGDRKPVYRSRHECITSLSFSTANLIEVYVEVFVSRNYREGFSMQALSTQLPASTYHTGIYRLPLTDEILYSMMSEAHILTRTAVVYGSTCKDGAAPVGTSFLAVRASARAVVHNGSRSRRQSIAGSILDELVGILLSGPCPINGRSSICSNNVRNATRRCCLAAHL